LRLKDGLDIRCPRTTSAMPSPRSPSSTRKTGLFSRDIVAVDMRLPDRLVGAISEAPARRATSCSKTEAQEEGR